MSSSESNSWYTSAVNSNGMYDTTALTRSSTSDTSYATRASTSGTNYLTKIISSNWRLINKAYNTFSDPSVTYKKITYVTYNFPDIVTTYRFEGPNQTLPGYQNFNGTAITTSKGYVSFTITVSSSIQNSAQNYTWSSTSSTVRFFYIGLSGSLHTSGTYQAAYDKFTTAVNKMTATSISQTKYPVGGWYESVTNIFSGSCTKILYIK